jgi:hypothetical protein
MGGFFNIYEGRKNIGDKFRRFLGLIRRVALFSSQTAPLAKVGVLRPLPEMVRSALETRGCSSAGVFKTVTPILELLNFVQDRIRMHGGARLSSNASRRENFRWADLVQGTLMKGSEGCP